MDEETTEKSKILDKNEIKNELSNIVEKKLLPQKIVERIEKKLLEKNVKIGKDQLYNLVQKINTLLGSHTPYEHIEEAGTHKKQLITHGEQRAIQNIEEVASEDMKKLVDKIERLEDKIECIEKNKVVEGKQQGEELTIENIEGGERQETRYQREMTPLSEIPQTPEGIVLLLKWLQNIIDKLGKNHLPDILGYYVDIGWITEDVKLDLIKYAKGISDHEHREEDIKGFSNFSTKDHIQSLVFIHKITGKPWDERFIWRIDREMEKMTKSIQDNQFIN